MVPGSTLNWIAVNAVQQSNPQQEMKTNKMTTLDLRQSLSRSPLRLGFLLVPLAVACFALSPTAQATASQTDTALGKDALKSITTGVNDTALGYQAQKSNTMGGRNTATGSQTLLTNTIGNDNAATGYQALFSNNGNQNTATGSQALFSNTDSDQNTATGYQALFSKTSGGPNTAFGYQALFSNTTANYNTAIGYQALYNNIPGPPDPFGNVVGENNTATGYQALFGNTTGFRNTAYGFVALGGTTTGNNNTGIGSFALGSNTTGFWNTGIGDSALINNTMGIANTAIGQSVLTSNTTGSGNTATGDLALQHNTTGSLNIALGDIAGFNLSAGDNNIYISNVGVAAEDNTIRIGTEEDGGRLPRHFATFIAGIRDTTTGNGDAIAVVIDSNGQLGTLSSSARFKDEIKPMDKASEAILALHPVTFHYKNSSKGISQFGLIAEDVAKLNPDLVVRDRKGEIYSVRYEAVNAMLLNEFLKEHQKVEDLKKDFQATVAQLRAQLKEQAAQIQKVSARLEASKPAPQVVGNP
jgi:hypothetical protein